jgi:hypothetical protein
MTNLSKFWFLTTAVAILTLSGGVASAEDASATGSAAAKPSPLAGWVDLLGSTAIPSLSGLIQPENMGLLSDNPLTVEDNPIDVELLSGNETNFLSGIRILSGITVNVEIHVHDGERAKPERRAGRSARAERSGRAERGQQLEPPAERKPTRQPRESAEGRAR